MFGVLAIKYVAYGGYRVVDKHTRACPAHHGTNLLAHGGLVAVYGAALARRLVVAKLAAI